MNNDGELAVDITENDEIGDLLRQYINKAGKIEFSYFLTFAFLFQEM